MTDKPTINKPAIFNPSKLESNVLNAISPISTITGEIPKSSSKKLEGTACIICGLKWAKGRKFIYHHLSYEYKLTVLICAKCHLWLHGSSKVFKHPFIEQYGRDLGPYMFALRVVAVYAALLINPLKRAVQERVVKQTPVIMPEKETVH